MEPLFLQVLACIPLKSLNWDGLDFNEHLQHEVLSKVFRNDIVTRYPLSSKYLLSFLKTVIKKVEAQNYEVIDELYDVLGTLVSTNTELGGYSHRSYYIGSDHGYITIKESVNLVSCGTTGLRTWEAAFRMAEWAMNNKHIFKNRHVVEIGCGCGLLGLIISRITNPSSYTFTDHHDDVIDLLQANIDINGDINGEDSHNIYTVAKLNWFSPSSFIDSVPYDVVIGSDVVFDKDLSVALVTMLKKMFKNNPGCVVFIACTVRNEDTYEHFTDTLANSSLRYNHCNTSLPTNQVFYYDRTLPINILKIFQ